MVDFAADAIAYQPTQGERQTYAEIHGIFAQTLQYLALEAGHKAPLVIVSHSLGTVITSNYLYDLQHRNKKGILPISTEAMMGDTPLERGETLSRLFTLGSPIALWSLRYKDFGRPISIVHDKFSEHYPHVTPEWINMYDRDDVIGYPLKTLSESYGKAVTKDVQVNTGGIFSFWNPASHTAYLTDKSVVKPIAKSIADVRKALN